MGNLPGRVQFKVIEDKAKEGDVGIGVLRQGWPRQRRRLYVLVESTTDDQEGCHRGVEIIKRTFSQEKLSVTASLTNALKAAHQAFLDENRQRAPEKRVGLGVTCAMVQGNDLFLAQAGSNLAYLFSNRGFQRILPNQREGEDNNPLGLAEDLHVRLSRFSLETDSALVIASSSLSGLLSEEDLVALMNSGQAGKAHELYLIKQLERWFPALLIRPARRASNLFSELLSPLLSSPSEHWRENIKPALLRMLRPTVLLLFLVLGSLAIVGSAWYIRGYVTRRSETRFADFLERAQMMRQEALIPEDRESTRQRLEEAKSLVDKALEIKKQDPSALALAEELVSDLAKVNAVFELSDVRLVADFTVLEDGQAELSKIIIRNSDAYVLDEGNGRIYRFPLEGALDPDLAVPEMLSCPSVSKLLGILWMPSGGLRSKGQLIIFDNERNFWVYENNGFQPLKVRGAGRWTLLETATGWQGNLYVLDPPANQVWRYYPTENGYDSEMKGILDSCDLQEAVDSAIDGSVYVLLRSGAILKFTLGRLQDFTQGGIDKPLSTPGAIFCTPDNVFIYVVDAGNQRIVAFRRDGQFQHQLVSEHFGRLQNIFVDENKGVIYVLSDNKVYIASLPKLSGDNEL